MEKKRIRLQMFGESDFATLIAEIPDERFLLRWAGPRYCYPLTGAQLAATLAQTTGTRPRYQVFKALRSASPATLGHVQLMNIDHSAGSCILGRVLIYRAQRGNGLGKCVVDAAVRFAFCRLGLNEINLKVFDFNIPAIRTYKFCGFRDYRRDPEALAFRDERWNILGMKLTRPAWMAGHAGHGCRSADGEVAARRGWRLETSAGEQHD